MQGSRSVAGVRWRYPAAGLEQDLAARPSGPGPDNRNWAAK